MTATMRRVHATCGVESTVEPHVAICGAVCTEPPPDEVLLCELCSALIDSHLERCAYCFERYAEDLR